MLTNAVITAPIIAPKAGYSLRKLSKSDGEEVCINPPLVAGVTFEVQITAEKQETVPNNTIITHWSQKNIDAPLRIYAARFPNRGRAKISLRFCSVMFQSRSSARSAAALSWL